jgi:hypothetical protein
MAYDHIGERKKIAEDISHRKNRAEYLVCHSFALGIPGFQNGGRDKEARAAVTVATDK